MDTETVLSQEIEIADALSALPRIRIEDIIRFRTQQVSSTVRGSARSLRSAARKRILQPL
jgi:hypothetical protein